MSIDTIKGIAVTTMDTGPLVEDMYAEIYTNDTMYIILSEATNFKSIVLETLHSALSLRIEAFIEATTYHYNKTFVLYEKTTGSVDFKNSEEKKAAILESAISCFCDANKDRALYGYIFAVMSLCPMYILVSRSGQIATLNAAIDRTIPFFTSKEKCLNMEQFVTKKLTPKEYIQLLAGNKYNAIINLEHKFFITAEAAEKILLSLISLRDDPMLQEHVIENATQNSSQKNNQKKKGFFSRLFNNNNSDA